MNFHKVQYWLLYLAVILSIFVPLTVTALADPLDTWHARYSSPTNRLWGVAYGNNTFVAVGDNGTVLTSPNGITWAPKTSGVTGSNLLGVTFGNGKFIAVGTNGAIITSTTGETWVKKNSGFNNVIFSGVAYGNNTFVVVGEGGTILVSSDGEIWTAKVSGTNDSFTCVAFGNDVFVAVGYCNNVFTSSDGETWRRTMMWGVCTGSPARELTGVAYGNNMFVAVGVVPGAAEEYIGSVFISEDNKTYSPAGDSWTEIGFEPPFSYPPGPLRGVAFGYNTFIAVGNYGSDIYTSLDGLHWTPRNPGIGVSLYGVSFLNGSFTVVGYDGVGNYGFDGAIIQSDLVANLIVNKAGTGAGAVTPRSGTINWNGNLGSALYDSSANLVLDASADNVSTFAGWSGACSGTGVCAVTIGAPTTVNATFNLKMVQQYMLTVTKSGTGAGTVTSSPSGINCGSACTALYDASTQVTLTALADASSTFAGWSGACSSTDATCTVTLDASKNVTATFDTSGAREIVSLTTGWNFISFPKQPSGTAISSVFANITAKVRVIWGYDNLTKTWVNYKPGIQDPTLSAIEPGKGYWIYMNSSGAVDITNWAAPQSAAIQLYDGWNLIGYSGTDGADAAAVLNGVSDKWQIMWTWDSGQWSAKTSDNTTTLQVPSLSNMKQGKAYWVKKKAVPVALTGGTFTSGDFKVIVAEGTMPQSINAISPEAKPEITVPDALPIKTNETNITAGAKAYTLNLAGSGFMTTASGAVTIMVPFDPSLVPDPSKLNSLSIYLKILDPVNNVAIPVHGRVEGNKIIIELRGLPPTMTFVVVFCPGMAGVVASDDSISPTAFKPEETSFSLGAKKWYVIVVRNI